jgi:hypothetical protein
MKRVTWAAAGMAVLVTVATSQAPRAQSGDTIHLDVVVTEKDGKPITDLKQAELQVEDDGKKVEITGFTAVSLDATPTPGDGRVAVIILDDTAPANATQPFQALAATFLQATPPGAKVSVVRFHNDADSINYEGQTVMSRLTSFQAGVVPFAFDITQEEFLNLTAKVAEGLKEPANHRKAILCIGMAPVCTMPARSKNDEGRKWQTWAHAMTALAKANASLYAFMPIPQTTFDFSPIDFTGGTAFTNAQNFTPFAQRIWAELGNHYVVEYVGQPGQKDARNVSVKTTRKNAVVHARKQR